MPTLELLGLGRTYPGALPVEALRGVTVEIKAGEFVAIEGASGGGKSTLLNLIGLLDAPTSGTYAIGGTVVDPHDERTIARLRAECFGFIFQSFHLLDRRPVADSVELGLLYRAVPARIRRERAVEALALLGIERLASTPANLLSGGERQRVAIARALASRAPVIVADEPTGNLDSANSDTVVSSLRTLNERGATVILVTHSPEVASHATRRLRVRDGVIVEDSGSRVVPGRASEDAEAPRAPDGSPSTVRARDLVVDAFASVTSRMGRAAGLIGSVALAVALAVASLGISESSKAQVAATFDAHANRTVTVEWGSDSANAEATTAESAALSESSRRASRGGCCRPDQGTRPGLPLTRAIAPVVRCQRIFGDA